MIAGGGGFPPVAGEARHIPVLGGRALEFLRVRDGGIYIDATFGAGGYARAMLAAADCKVIGIDRDPTAVAVGFDLVDAAKGRLTLVEDRFSNLEAVARSIGVEAVDGVVLDLGVSSMQLDTPGRGFSFRLDGPLDMRMGSSGASAADVMAVASERDLATIVATLGEVAAALAAAERMLKAGGRLVVISFHSLEDRIVKTFLAERGRVSAGSRHQPEAAKAAPSFRILTRKPVIADDDEISRNPRARSAKLRAAVRTDAPARDGGADDLLPRLPSLADVMGGRRR